MPSYRITITIGALQSGVMAASVLPTAADAVREFCTVEAADVGIVSGMPRVTVRFTADDAELALQVGRHAVAVTGGLAEPLAWKVTERVGGRWYVVH